MKSGLIFGLALITITILLGGMRTPLFSDSSNQKSIDELIEDLASRTTEVQSDAFAEIYRRGSSTVPALLAALDNKKYLTIRRQLLHALDELGDMANSAVPKLAEELNNQSAGDSDVVAVALDHIGTVEAEAALRKFEAEKFQTDSAASFPPGDKVRGWQGYTSKIHHPEIDRITSQEEWKSLWSRHVGPTSGPPTIDFSKEMVIAIFEGRSYGPRGLRISNFETDSNGIRLTQSVFYSDFMDTTRKVAEFALAVVPRFDGRLTVGSKYKVAMAFDVKTHKPLGIQERTDKTFEPLTK